MVVARGSGVRVLALMDGSPEYRGAALAAADLFASTPAASFTVLAPARIASPDSAPHSGEMGSLVALASPTASLMEAVRLIEARGFPTRLRTTEGSLLADAARTADAHDIVVLPRSLAKFAEDFSVPVLVAP